MSLKNRVDNIAPNQLAWTGDNFDLCIGAQDKASRAWQWKRKPAFLCEQAKINVNLKFHLVERKIRYLLRQAIHQHSPSAKLGNRSAKTAHIIVAPSNTRPTQILQDTLEELLSISRSQLVILILQQHTCHEFITLPFYQQFDGDLVVIQGRIPNEEVILPLIGALVSNLPAAKLYCQPSLQLPNDLLIENVSIIINT